MIEELFKDNVVSPEEVKVIGGFDLSTINDDDNPSNKEERMIYKAQSIVCGFIYRYFKRNALLIYKTSMSENEQYHFKMAIIKQIIYMINAGDIASISSLSYSHNDIASKKLSDNVLDELAQAHNLTSTKIGGNGFGYATWWF